MHHPRADAVPPPSPPRPTPRETAAVTPPSHPPLPSPSPSPQAYVCVRLPFVVVCLGGVWCGVVWCSVVWCGVVWCGVLWCGYLHVTPMVLSCFSVLPYITPIVSHSFPMLPSCYSSVTYPLVNIVASPCSMPVQRFSIGMFQCFCTTLARR